ncbi:MAG TPA: cell division protein FtsQ/DivIB [Steroidobacteraceae bacterium]|nr:cell division protein FtsQ/DivIB [Steroidobacteraceae bacterium]
MLSSPLKRRNRRKLARPQWRLPPLNWRRFATALAFFALAACVAYGMILALDQPIRIVSIEGRLQRVSPVQVEQAVTGGLEQGFMSVDLEAVRRRVEQLPWVDRARVQRRWPHGLRIEVTEQVAAARWGDSGLLNTRGELFMKGARHVPAELPRLTGPDGTEWQVAQRYLSAQGRLIEAGMRLAALDLDARGAWQLELANGVSVRLGRRQVDERLDRFIQSALPVMSGRAADISYVDMRYSNGFAVGWKSPGGTASRGVTNQRPGAPPPRSPA